MNQLELDFSTLEHKENNFDSQRHFEENKERFTNQCRKVYQVLLKGERLTTTKALLEYGIGDLRRRIKDLKDQFEVPIQDEYVKDEEGKSTRYKEYFLPQ